MCVGGLGLFCARCLFFPLLLPCPPVFFLSFCSPTNLLLVWCWCCVFGSSLQFVVMVRDPRTRLRSAYEYGMHAHGQLPKDRRRMAAEVKTAQDFARFPGIAGCQVKMLLGHFCAEDIEVTEHMTSEAIRVLQMAAFVGITDEWDASVCLFHAMYGGRLRPTQFDNVRNTSHFPRSFLEKSRHPSNSSSFSRSGQGKEDVLSKQHDPEDWRLFQAAQLLFRQRQMAYGVPVRRV